MLLEEFGVVLFGYLRFSQSTTSENRHLVQPGESLTGAGKSPFLAHLHIAVRSTLYRSARSTSRTKTFVLFLLTLSVLTLGSESSSRKNLPPLSFN